MGKEVKAWRVWVVYSAEFAQECLLSGSVRPLRDAPKGAITGHPVSTGNLAWQGTGLITVLLGVF